MLQVLAGLPRHPRRRGRRLAITSPAGISLCCRAPGTIRACGSVGIAIGRLTILLRRVLPIGGAYSPSVDRRSFSDAYYPSAAHSLDRRRVFLADGAYSPSAGRRSFSAA